MCEMLSEAVWLQLLGSMPLKIQADVSRYRRWQDRQSHLLGKLLLRKCLSPTDDGKDCLERLGAERFGRTTVGDGMDCSISHSHEYTVCAVTDQGKIGVDIEKVRPVDLHDFYACMDTDDREAIQASTDKERAFFRFWTKKESVLKADGRGLLIPMQEVQIRGEEAIIQGTRWFVKELEIDPGCMCHLASNFRSGWILPREISIRDFL